MTTVRLTDDLAERVKVYCSLTGASVNGALVVALERLVEAEQEKLWGLANRRLDGLAGLDQGRGESRSAATPVTAAEPSGPARSSQQVTPDWRGGKP